MDLVSKRSNVHGDETSRFTDLLTGLGNRWRLVDKIARLVDERSQDPAPFTIGIANIDGFKPINDLFGHAAGDEILCQIAHRLKNCLPDGATCARLDGDEFGFLLPLVFDQDNATRLGKVLAEVLSAPYDLGDRNVRLSTSFGFSIYPFAGEDHDALLESADTALYRSKRRGRNQITVYSEEIAEQIKRGTQVEQALRRAINADEVEVHFQPIIDLATNMPVGFEGLARWTDSELGFVSPASFIPLAEERGFIDSLTEVLLKKAVRVAQTWPEGMFLSFNLSSAQLVNPATASNIINILHKGGIDAQAVEMEITETAMMTDPDTANKIMNELRGAGIGISLDDFGTGQSSLGRLRDFAFDKIKIDRSFVSKITSDRPTKYIVKAILDMCNGLDHYAVAEGIETEEQAVMLREMGCVYGQGYLFGKAENAKDTCAYLEDLGILPRGSTLSYKG
jgi:diguanylate cyclase (GGDEF)-like protein